MDERPGHSFLLQYLGFFRCWVIHFILFFRVVSYLMQINLFVQTKKDGNGGGGNCLLRGGRVHLRAVKGTSGLPCKSGQRATSVKLVNWPSLPTSCHSVEEGRVKSTELRAENRFKFHLRERKKGCRL